MGHGFWVQTFALGSRVHFPVVTQSLQGWPWILSPDFCFDSYNLHCQAVYFCALYWTEFFARVFISLFFFLIPWCRFTRNDFWEHSALGAISGIRPFLLCNWFRFWSEPITNKHHYQPAAAWQWNNNSLRPHTREALFIGSNNKKKLKKGEFKDEE